MTEETADRFERLAASDSAVAPLAWLQRAALKACADPVWDDAVSEFRPQPPVDTPLLHQATLLVHRGAFTALWYGLLEVAEEHAVPGVEPLLRGGTSALDPIGVIAASVANDRDSLDTAAAEIGADAGLLATLAHIAALPLLQACGRKAAPALAAARWQPGYCPVCAAWPTLAELRGLERERWLRCGRCGAGWAFPLQACPYCRNADHRTLGYLAADDERDTRRAEVCQSCGGFLKTLATLGPLTIENILLHDMATLELDIVALDREYTRPDRPGFTLHVDLRPVPEPDGANRWTA